MSKSGVMRAMRRPRAQPSVQLPEALEGQIAELCRDLAVEAKRMRRLYEQVDELRTVIRQWAEGAEPYPDGGGPAATRAGRRRAATGGS